ncbi:hypothetical protein LJC46_09955 [Desulfovibrio sp. OttesenSCG-928-G15]|nr:hypothetical protein [Desulfovibrio sp. OttesenSCG-928-G15]
MFDTSFSHITADAATPEQTVPYVLGVSGRKALGCGPFVAYVQEGHAVLAAFPGLGGCVAWEQRAAKLVALAERAERAEGVGAQDCYGTPEALRMLADTSPDPSFAGSVEAVLADLPESITRVTVMAPYRPACAPAAARSLVDCYWALPVPPPPGRAKTA